MALGCGVRPPFMIFLPSAIFPTCVIFFVVEPWLTHTPIQWWLKRVLGTPERPLAMPLLPQLALMEYPFGSTQEHPAIHPDS